MNKSDSNQPVPDIDKIIIGCQKGDRQAQKTIYELFSARLFAVCMRYCGNRMEAEDFLHDGFLKIFTRIDQFNKTGPFEAWIRRIMVNTILEEFRKQKRIRYVGEDEIPIDKSDPEDSEQDRVVPDMNQVLSMVDQLPERYRMVFNLYVMEGYSHEDIAQALDISIGTSKSNLSRARQWLKTRLLSQVTNKQEAP